MKKLFVFAFAAVAGVCLATSSFAADEKSEAKTEKKAAKEKTFTGEAKCAKCALHESDKCQNVVEVEGKDGKKTTYYLAQNDVSKAFHGEICKAPKKVTLTGKAHKNAEGKMELTASKIDKAE